jgi:hypothetical protein
MEVLKELNISLSRLAALDEWTALMSPGRAALLIDYVPDTRKLRTGFEWVNLEDLAVVRSWTWECERDVYIHSVSDYQMAGGPEILGQRVCTPEGNFDWNIHVDRHSQVAAYVRIRSLEGPCQRVACSASRNGDCGSDPQFVNNEVLLVQDKLLLPQGTLSQERIPRMTLMRTDGQVLLTRELPPNQMFGGAGLRVRYPASPSADGRRFALPISDLKGGIPAWDIGPREVLNRIEVYDFPSQRWILAVDAKRQHIKRLSGLALSPDGSLLALIDQNGILWLFRVPEIVAAPTH